MRRSTVRRSTLLSCAGLLLVGVGLTCVIVWGAPQHRDNDNLNSKREASADAIRALRQPDASGMFVGTITAVTTRAIVVQLPYLGQVRTLSVGSDTVYDTANQSLSDLHVGDVVTVTMYDGNHCTRVTSNVPAGSLQSLDSTGGSPP